MEASPQATDPMPETATPDQALEVPSFDDGLDIGALAPEITDQPALSRGPSLDGEVLAPLGLAMLAAIGAVATVAALVDRAGSSSAGAWIGAGLVCTAIVTLLVRFQLRRTLRPVFDAVEAAMQDLEEGNYGARIGQLRLREAHGLVESFNRMATIIAHQRERLMSLAATDALTGIANNRHFDERLRAELKRADRSRRPVAVVVLNLDRFKQVNERLGHTRGDEALQAVAKALGKVVRSTDLIGRIDGDTFGVLLPGADAGYAREVADRARGALGRISQAGVRLGASAGFACFPAHAGADANLVQLASVALNIAKRAGGDQTVKYDPEQAASLPTVREQRAQIMALLEQPEPITPVFQPIVNLQNGEIAGYEALSRFNHLEERPPDAWFNQAHACGLGPRLEAAAIRFALETPGRPSGTYLSINFSPSALSSRKVRDELPKDMSEVVVEITEHELAAQDNALEQAIEVLRRRGARIAVDDAGAGYAGLKQVMRVQPDIIKLDRGLVEKVHQDSAKAALIEFFVMFAGRVGAKVCTEGIETAEELRALIDLNVGYGQGYVLQRPGPPWAELANGVQQALSLGRLRSFRATQKHGDEPLTAGPVNRRTQRFATLQASYAQRGRRESPGR